MTCRVSIVLDVIDGCLVKLHGSHEVRLGSIRSDLAPIVLHLGLIGYDHFLVSEHLAVHGNNVHEHSQQIM